MFELICTSIFVMIILIMGFLTKDVLYANQHELSIENELNTFDDNYRVIEAIDKAPDFKLGQGHLYQ